MNAIKHFRTLALSLLLGSSLSTYALGADCGSKACTADETITSQVVSGFNGHAELQAPNSIRVQTHHQIVYLYGHVSTGLQREEAVSIAQQVPTVKRVVSSIRTTNAGG